MSGIGPVGRALALAVVVPFGIGAAVAAATTGPDADVRFSFSDPEIVESSGLVARDGLVMTVNDSGDAGRVFVVDDAGDTVGVTTWSAEATDVEALAPAGRGHVWVGDIGDNRGVRESVTIARVPVGVGDRSVDPVRYELTYPGGPADAETLMRDPVSGRLVVVTKGIFGGEVLLAPATLDPDGPNRLRRVGSALGVATDGSFLPDGRHFVVRGYSSAAVYSWPDVQELERFSLPDQEQGEGLAVDEGGQVLVSTEGAGSQVLQLRLPPRVRRVLAPEPAEPPTRSPTATASPDPSPEPDPSATEPDAAGDQGRSAWPWLLGGVVGAGALVVLVRSLRPR